MLAEEETLQPQVAESIDNNWNRTFLQNTRIHNDLCSYENQNRISSKPMKYYVNQLNSPQANPFETYSIIGNQKVYDVRNEFERPLPTRLNPIYPVYVEPYPTTPFLANMSPNRVNVDTDSNLRVGQNMRPKNSESVLSEIDYNQFNPGVSGFTVQNAGQFSNARIQSAIGNYTAQNNVIFGNGVLPGGTGNFGISSRNILYNYQETNNC